MAERFDVAARRHLDTAELLEGEGMLDDAGYHYGLVGENAVKQSVVMVCGSLPADLRKHFSGDLIAAIQGSVLVAGLLTNGRLGGGLARDLHSGKFTGRFDKWGIHIRYADSHYPVTAKLVRTWKADAVALLRRRPKTTASYR